MEAVSDSGDPWRDDLVTRVWAAAFTLPRAPAQDVGRSSWVRGLMTLGVGGAWIAGAMLVGESLRPRGRKAIGMVQAACASGWG
ncbi:MAG: hypothetical protein ACRYGL_15795 [Janthinobacterium lividum]